MLGVPGRCGSRKAATGTCAKTVLKDSLNRARRSANVIVTANAVRPPGEGRTLFEN
jgi:hypothetical protein